MIDAPLSTYERKQLKRAIISASDQISAEGLDPEACPWIAFWAPISASNTATIPLQSVPVVDLGTAARKRPKWWLPWRRG